jgi:hypothetical protein
MDQLARRAALGDDVAAHVRDFAAETVYVKGSYGAARRGTRDARRGSARGVQC